MNEATQALRETSRLGIFLGIATIILGGLAIIAPLFFGLAVAVLVAIFLVAAGIAETVYAFRADSFGKGILQFLFGGITIVFGLAMFFWPGVGLTSLTLFLAAYFLVDGIFTIAAGFKVKPVEGWGWMVFNGIVTIILAGLIWNEWPLSGQWAIGVLVGVRLIFAGWSMIALGSVGEGISEEMKRAT